MHTYVCNYVVTFPKFMSLSCIRMYVACCLYLPVVMIIVPPVNRMVHRGDNVNISCGYISDTALPVTWIINGISFTQQEILNSPLYQLNNPTIPTANSLTIFSINGTTTFQCIVLSTPSTRGTVTIIGMYVCMYVCMYT